MNLRAGGREEHASEGEKKRDKERQSGGGVRGNEGTRNRHISSIMRTRKHTHDAHPFVEARVYTHLETREFSD